MARFTELHPFDMLQVVEPWANTFIGRLIVRTIDKKGWPGYLVNARCYDPIFESTDDVEL